MAARAASEKITDRAGIVHFAARILDWRKIPVLQPLFSRIAA